MTDDRFVTLGCNYSLKNENKMMQMTEIYSYPDGKRISSLSLSLYIYIYNHRQTVSLYHHS